MPRPFLQIHHQWMLPHYVLGAVAGFGPIDPNIPCALKVNNPQPCLPCLQPHVLPPPPPLDQESNAKESSSESSESREGDSLEANHGSP